MCGIVFENVTFKIVFKTRFSGAWGRLAGGVSTMWLVPSALNAPVKMRFSGVRFLWQEAGGGTKQGKCIKFKALVQENTGTQDGFLGDGWALRMPGKQSSRFSALAGRAYSCTAPSQIISTNVFKTSGWVWQVVGTIRIHMYLISWMLSNEKKITQNKITQLARTKTCAHKDRAYVPEPTGHCWHQRPCFCPGHFHSTPSTRLS